MTHHSVVIRHISISVMLKFDKYVHLEIHEIHSVSKITIEATQMPSLNGGGLIFNDKAQEKHRKPKIRNTCY